MSGNSTDEGQFSGDDSSRIGTPPLTPLETPTVDTRAEYRFDVRGREEEGLHIIPKNNSPLTLCVYFDNVPFSRAFSPYFLFTYVQSDETRGEEELARDFEIDHAPFLLCENRASTQSCVKSARREGKENA